MALVIHAPHALPNSSPKLKVFLAGSIEMDRAENWQTRLTETLQHEDIIFFNPRRDQWDASWKQSIDNPQFREQVDWEMDGLELADIIVVYFDPNTKSPITLLEVGLHAASGKILLCCPDGFWRKGNVEIVCDRYNIPLYNHFSDLVEALKMKTSTEEN